MVERIDDKSERCIPFILSCIKAHQAEYAANGEKAPPFFVGLNGVQGAGKTTLVGIATFLTVTSLHRTLTAPPHSLPTAVLSIDDLYLPHAAQTALARSHPENPLVQHRGQPGTHDIPLGVSLFNALANREPNIKLPSYDKSAFNGAGDRAPSSAWTTVNAPADPPIELIIFEGWCVGFRALSPALLWQKYSAAQSQSAQHAHSYRGRLGKLPLASVQFVNEELHAYDALTDRLAAFVHIDAEDTQFVYAWRLEQEAALRREKGSGMSDEAVVEFVDGYYPAYELYTDELRAGIFGPERGGRQLRLVVGRDRGVKEVHEL